MKEKLLGSFCLASSGHDSSTTYLIVGFENNYYLLANGKEKTISKPKKKNPKHINLLGKSDEKIHKKLCEGSQVTNEEVKRAIKLLNV